MSETASTLITRKELAHELKVNYHTIARWEREGLPHYRAGTKPRYILSEVLAWFKAHREGSLNG